MKCSVSLNFLGFLSWLKSASTNKCLVLAALPAKNQKACLDMKSSIAFDFQAHVFKATGIKFDKITAVESTYLQKYHPDNSANATKKERNDALQYFIEAKNSAPQYVTGENTIEVIPIVLRAALDDGGIPRTLEENKIQPHFAAYVDQLCEEAGQDMAVFPELRPWVEHGTSMTFEYAALQVGLRCAIFRTSNGFMGLGPGMVQVGGYYGSAFWRLCSLYFTLEEWVLSVRGRGLYTRCYERRSH